MYFCYFLLFGLELQQVFITVEHPELLYPGVSTGHKEQYTIFVWGVNRQGQGCHLKTAGHQHLLTSAEPVQHHLRVNFLKITFPHSFVLKCWSSQLVPNCPDFCRSFLLSLQDSVPVSFSSASAGCYKYSLSPGNMH